MITKQEIQPVITKKVVITDSLFASYVNAIAEHLLPYQWKVLNDQIPGAEKSHCIDNFRIAAGEMEGTHQGAVFQDTDLYKWLETVAFCIANGTGREYIEIADGAIALIGRAQESDGYINTYFTISCPDKKWTNLVEGHELYSGGHMIEAAVAYFNATGKKEFLYIACKFADLVCRVFGLEEGKCKGYPGHQEIEVALVKLYQATGNRSYLTLADYFIRQRGQEPNYLMEEYKSRQGRNLFPEFREYDDKYAQVHAPVLKQETAEGHAVRAVYMYSAMADLARVERDEEMAAACQRLYENIVKKRMYITGGIGSSGTLERFTADYDLPNDRMYCESCASVGLMMFAQRMASLTGEAVYYDVVERALCNTVLGGISKEGKRYFYVNPLEVWPQNCLASTSMAHVKPVRQKWFGCACCPPNIARTLASLGQYIYAQSEDSLYVNQFISSSSAVEIGGQEIEFSMDSTYMKDGAVRITAKCGKREEALYLRVRIPEYFKKPALKVNGKDAPLKFEQGYAVIPLEELTEVCLQGEILPRFVAANRNVRADMGRLAIMKGPYVYCMEEEDNGDNLAAVLISDQDKIEECALDSRLPGELPMLKTPAKKVTQTIAETDELYGTPAYTEEKMVADFVPYALWCNRTPGEMQVWVRAQI